MSATDLAAHRARIDRIDAILVRLVAARQRQVALIARLKTGPDNVHDPERVSVILNRVRRVARGCGLEEAIAIPVWRELLERSAEAQQAWLRSSEGGISHLDEGQTEAVGPSGRPSLSHPENRFRGPEEPETPAANRADGHPPSLMPSPALRSGDRGPLFNEPRARGHRGGGCRRPRGSGHTRS